MHHKQHIKHIIFGSYYHTLIKESQQLFPHLTPSFIQQHHRLLAHLIQSHQQTKRNYYIFSLKENIQKKQFYKESLLVNYYKFILQSSTSVEHLAQLLDETYFVLFKNPYALKKKILKEYRRHISLTSSLISEQKKRSLFNIHKDLDHHSADDSNPNTVAYWKKIAQQEPNAQDIQPFIKYIRYYEKGYNPFKLYSIPDEEPGGSNPQKPAIQQKLYNRYLFKKQLQKQNLSPQEIQQKLQQYDKDNSLLQYTQQSSTQTSSNFFTNLLKKAARKVTGVFAGKEFATYVFGSPEERKQVEQLVKKVPEEKQQSWYEKVKQIIIKIVDLYNDPKWKPVFQGAFRTIAYIAIMWVLGIVAASLGPWGILLLSIVKAVLSLITIFKNAKELYNKFGELSEGKIGIQGLINIAKNIIKPANLLFIIIRVISIVIAIWGLVSALQSAFSSAQQILKSMGYTDQQIQAAAEGNPPKETTTSQQGNYNELSGKERIHLYKDVDISAQTNLNLGNTPDEQVFNSIRLAYANGDFISDVRQIGSNISRFEDLEKISSTAVENAANQLFTKYFQFNLPSSTLQSPISDYQDLLSQLGYTKIEGIATVEDFLKFFIQHEINMAIH